LAATAANPPYAVFSDSLEVYNSDWTPNFLDEFRKRRGYDLVPYIRALAEDAGDNTAAIPPDSRKPLTELPHATHPTPLHPWRTPHRPTLPIATCRPPARPPLQQRAGRSARRRRHAVARRLLHALGYVRQPSLRPARHFLRNLDVAPLTRLPRHAPRHQGRGR